MSTIKKLGKTKGLALLSTQMKAGSKYLWMCKNNHQCHATEQQVKNGFRCKKCNNFISEEKVRFIFEQLTKNRFIKTRKVLNGRLELDGYCEKLKIAFEYNGSQHYYKHPLWHYVNNTLKDQQERDYRKTKLCQSKNILKLDISFKQIQNLEKLTILIKNFLLDHQVPIYQNIDWSQFDYLPNNYKILKNCSKKRNGELLTPCFLGSHSKHSFKCNVCDCKWEAKAKDVLNKNSWCPSCADNQLKNISYLSKLAKDLDYSLLSTTYLGMNKKYKFLCQKCENITIASGNNIQQKKKCSQCSGNKRISANRFNDYIRRRNIKLITKFSKMSHRHMFQCLTCDNIWETVAANIWNNRGCPNCAINNKKLSIQDLHKLAKTRNLLLLSKDYLGMHTLHKWQCIKCNKKTEIKPSNVRRGTSCRKCKKNAICD